MKKLFVILFVMVSALNGFGWGATGHRATGLVAERYLSKKAKKKIDAILGGESLAMVSNWMDEIRSDSTYNYTADWHWTTIPDGGKYEDVASNPDGKVIMMIEKIIGELKRGGLSAKQEQEYLKMLVHMIGDMHQPLHVGKPGDRGGNDVKVKWFRNDSNLHRVWDSEMIDDTKLSYTELADALGKPGKDKLAKWQQGTVRDWALESVSYRPQVYDIGNGSLSYSYSYKYLPIAKERLLQAGIRLAALLNTIYG
ncbi:MAG TPA: S1/P1 nuclease [Cyclobacteriaceae bacterium]|nr:S1/P1 nuclease [Cyclobacteriaceae bacterium]